MPSVSLLRTVVHSNLSLQTLNGMLCHCGEKAFAQYEPAPCESFAELADMMERCYVEQGASQYLRPSTLEGCVVRISDILGYLGKDRQDAITVGVLNDDTYPLRKNAIGTVNREFIGNVSTNLIKNSLGKPYLKMDEEVYEGLIEAKAQNGREIYSSPQAHERLDDIMEQMMTRLYERCREDLIAGDEESPIYRHHINAWMIKRRPDYASEPTDDIVVDYLACMTDEYLIDLFNYLFPEEAVSEQELYVPYFRA